MKMALLHRIIYKAARILLMPFFKYGVRFEFEKVRTKDKPYVVLANHTSNMDPILVGMSFPSHMYFVAGEHIFRKGFLSKLLKTFVLPIMRVKSRTEVLTAINILKALKSGSSVCMFAEGSCSWNGESGRISVATAKLVKRCGTPLITYRLEGSYLTMPRWAKTIRRGKISGHAVREYSSAELSEMTEAEIQESIYRDLYVNAYADNEKAQVAYIGKNLAENLETVLYVCPRCKRIATLKSSGDMLECGCGLSLRYNRYGFFESAASDAPPFKTVLDWDKWQSSYVESNAQSFRDMPADVPILSDIDQSLYSFEPGGRTTLIGQGSFRLYRDRLALEDATSGDSIVFPLSEVTDMALMLQTLLAFTVDGRNYYEVRSKHPRSSLKYLTICKCLTELRIML